MTVVTNMKWNGNMQNNLNIIEIKNALSGLKFHVFFCHRNKGAVTIVKLHVEQLTLIHIFLKNYFSNFKK